MTKEMKFSVIDAERKYSYDYAENTYGEKSLVSYGANNDAPLLFYNCYSNSATLKSIIDGMCAYILGEDVIISDEGAKWREKVNSAGMTMRQLIAQITLDYLIYGGFAIQVIYSKLGTVTDLYPLNFAKCRTNEYGTKIYYSKRNWSKYGTKSEEFDAFNREKFDINKPTQIYYFKGDFTKSVYPLPLWHGALNDVLTEMECSKYSLNSVAAGFMARYAIQFPNAGNLTNEQQNDIEEAIKAKFCGADTDSNFMLYFSPNSDKLQIDKIESDDTPEKFIAIKDNARSNIYTAMRCTPLLMGLPNASNGFSTNEYKDSFKLFQKTVIQPIQDSICYALDKIIGAPAVAISAFNIKFEEEAE